MNMCADGLSFYYLDVPPSHVGMMHFTRSADFGVVISGSAELVLPDGSKTTLLPGDSIVQRGNLHQWNNRSEAEWLRLLVVVADAKELEFEGRKIEGVQF